MKFVRHVLHLLIIMTMLVLTLTPLQAQAAAYDPVTKQLDGETLPLRFWQDRQPDARFYINAANRYLLETVTAPQFGTSAGEWSVMDLLRGMYTGAHYMNEVPEDYYEGYINRVVNYIIAKEGNLDRNKSTEWSRATLAMSALGLDIREIGAAGTYIKAKYVTTYKGEETIDTSNSLNQAVVKLDAQNAFTIDTQMGFEFTYTNAAGKEATGFAAVPAGTYTLNETGQLLQNNEVVNATYVEVIRGEAVATHTVSTLALANALYVLEKPYDFVEKLSTSHKFSYRQGINGPIWILIALETAGYDMYTEQELAARGVTVAAGDVNTKGKMIDYILGKEITNAQGRVGGWALSGKNADPDITMMAVQALAPYYMEAELFKEAYRTTVNAATSEVWDVQSDAFAAKYTAFKEAVERAVFVMAEDQQANGGYGSFGTLNSESIVQVIVGLTALQIDPLSDHVYLPTLDQTVSFIQEGAEVDGVTTNNMIDALLTFWAMGSGSSYDIGGFKHVTTGDDGGGGAGTVVNGMATDQAIYGLIAYDRFKQQQNRLYDMSDMKEEAYKSMHATTYTARYIVDGVAKTTQSFSPYELLVIDEASNASKWTTNADGTGVMYEAYELLSAPNEDVTLYAQTFKTLPKKEITDPSHTFTVQYNEPIFAQSVNNAKVYVKDDTQAVVPTTVTVGEDGASVHIAPEAPYARNRTYTIYVEKGIQTADASKTLVQPVNMSFIVK